MSGSAAPDLPFVIPSIVLVTCEPAALRGNIYAHTELQSASAVSGHSASPVQAWTNHLHGANSQ